MQLKYPPASTTAVVLAAKERVNHFVTLVITSSKSSSISIIYKGKNEEF
jgi:hypothetical protein